MGGKAGENTSSRNLGLAGLFEFVPIYLWGLAEIKRNNRGCAPANQVIEMKGLSIQNG
jgi:hypothetical protein